MYHNFARETKHCYSLIEVSISLRGVQGHSRAERLDGSYLRTFALELKEQLALTLAAFVTSI